MESQEMNSPTMKIGEDPIERQVPGFPPVDYVSCSGSVDSSLGDNPRAQLMLAQLAEEQMRQELELEHRHKMLQAANRTRLARLKLELSEMNVKSRLPLMDEQNNTKLVEECPISKSIPKDCATTGTSVVRIAPVTPRVELQYFDGNPCQYWKFIRQFENFIESNVVDDGQRMLYLLHYCKGQARHAIDGCSLLTAEVAYRRARDILNDLYGQSHVIARSMIEELLDSVARTKLNGSSMTELSIQMSNCETALCQLKCEADLDSLATLEAVVSRLPHVLQVGWARAADAICKEKRNPRFHDMQCFVAEEARIARSRFGHVAFRTATRISERPMKDLRRVHNTTSQGSHVQPVNNPNCYVCGGGHAVKSCRSFVNLDVQSRWRAVKEHRACFVCLRKGHRAEECSESSKCPTSGCTGKHHSLLHVVKSEKPVVQCNNINGVYGRVRLGIFPVTVFGPSRSVNTYAMLDNGADVSLVKECLLRELGIEPLKEELRIRTINSLTSLQSGSSELLVGPLGSKEPNVVIKRALSVPMLPGNNSCQTAEDALSWPHLNDLDLPEIPDTEVGLLIGTDTPDAHWVMEQRTRGREDPFAYRTLLGWVVFGPVSRIACRERTALCLQEDTKSIADLLSLLYDQEFADSSSCVQQLSREEKEALAQVENSCKLRDGHIEVRLPWKTDPCQLIDNREQAYARLQSLRKRFIGNPQFFERYKDVIKRNLKLGYSVRVPPHQLLPDFKPRWYLPHHAVINPKKPEKLRVVHDCAAKFKGVSLNDCLHQGPDTLRSLVGVLMRFRKERLALSADIEEMFMQVSIPEDDRGPMRFLWWPDDDLSQEPVEYQMAVHPFGAVSSPFVASFALKQCLTLCGGNKSALVAQSIRDNFYVDDLLISLEDEKDAVNFVEDLCCTLSKAGFRIRKWISNCTQVLEGLPDSELAHPDAKTSVISTQSDSTLGLQWISSSDVFHFPFRPNNAPHTRRGVLSVVSSLFDPLGLVAPMLLPAKLLLQNLCRQRLDWDADLPLSDVRIWNKWLSEISQLTSLKIPRCVKRVSAHIDRPQLHVFCDASEMGYGAVVYIRYVPENDSPYCSMIFAKARVAPIKSVTIPRLELAAAKLAISLYVLVQQEMQISYQRIWFWTDSTTVLYYINDKSKRFSTFVANRLAVIHHYSAPNQWRHVRSEDNPADLVSRGTNRISELQSWLNGPRFLTLDEEDWPSNLVIPVAPDDVELKKITSRVNVVSKRSDLAPILDYHSSWRKLVRAIGWLSRFKMYIVDKSSVPIGVLTVEELNRAERDILKNVQEEAFPDVARRLLSGGNCDRIHGAQIRKLNPIMDDGLICLNGRLIHATQSVVKRPIILPRSHAVTDLLIRDHHMREGHSGIAHVLSVIRENYWIIQGKAAVRRVLGRCILCRRFSARRCQQLMAPLPDVRTKSGGYPFQDVGVDYFGPFSVKRGRSLEKRYGCIFSCLQSRAVHLEVAHSLTTESFIMVLMRFVGRRGVPKSIYSDNGTNFVGAQKELREHIARWDKYKIQRHLAQRGTEWHFQPPFASHRGGVWERVIRSVRKILFALGLEQTVTDEVLNTLMIEAERIVNNRPLVPASSSDTEEVALTPNHLLLLHGNPGLPVSMKQLYLRGYKQACYLAHVFWCRWLKEYLPTLQIRQKWLYKNRNLKVGDLVLMIDESTYRGEWSLGRIVECYESNDGRVREVSVRSRGVVSRRDVRRLCLLEADVVEENQGIQAAPEDEIERGAVT